MKKRGARKQSRQATMKRFNDVVVWGDIRDSGPPMGLFVVDADSLRVVDVSGGGEDLRYCLDKFLFGPPRKFERLAQPIESGGESFRRLLKLLGAKSAKSYYQSAVSIQLKFVEGQHALEVMKYRVQEGQAGFVPGSVRTFDIHDLVALADQVLAVLNEDRDPPLPKFRYSASDNEIMKMADLS